MRPAGIPTVSSTCLAGHRRLRVRATVRMMPISIRKGSQVFRKPAQLDEEESGRERNEGEERNEQRANVIFV